MKTLLANGLKTWIPFSLSFLSLFFVAECLDTALRPFQLLEWKPFLAWMLIFSAFFSGSAKICSYFLPLDLKPKKEPVDLYTLAQAEIEVEQSMKGAGGGDAGH